MQLRQKVVLGLFIVLIGLMIASYITAQIIVLSSFRDLEKKDANLSMDQVTNAIDARINTLATSSRDYGSWDETYDYVAGNDPTYPDRNIIQVTFENIGVNMVVILDAAGEIVFSGTFDFETLGPFEDGDALVRDVLAYEEIMSGMADYVEITGIVNTRRGPMMLASVPVTDTAGTAEPNGVFVVGVLLTDATAADLSETLRMDITLAAANGSLPEDFRRAVEELDSGDEFYSEPKADDNERIVGFTDVFDLAGQPGLLIRIDLPRDVYDEGQTTVTYFLLALLAAGAVLGVILWIMLDTQLVTPLRRIGLQVHEIGTSGDLSQRIDLERSDELGLLVREVNQMVESLERTQQELKQANAVVDEARAEAVESSRLKTAFLDTITEELRNPLDAIKGYAGILLGDKSNPMAENARRLLERISENSEGVRRNIDEILDFTSLEGARTHLAMEPVQPTDLLPPWEREGKALAERKGLKFRAVLDPQLPPQLMGNKEGLNKVVINLLANAVKFTEQGEVSLELATAAEGQWQIIVRDTGIGISDRDANYIFEAFRNVGTARSRDYRGVGIGLALVQRYATTMGGTVSLETEQGKGSTFTVSLPLQLPPKRG